MCGYFCIGFINFVLKRNILLDYTNLFPPSKYENYVVNFVVSIENLTILKCYIFSKKH